MSNRKKTKSNLQSAIFHQYRIRLRFRRALCAAIVLIGAAFFSSIATAAKTGSDVSEYRSTLTQLIDTIAEILYTIDPDNVDEIADAVVQLEGISDEQLETVYMENLSLEQLQQQLDQLESHLSAVRLGVETRQIEIPSVEVRPPVCRDTIPEFVLAASAASGVAEGLLGTLKYVCFQQNAGVNAALACTGLEVVASVARNEYKLENFCLMQVHEAKEKSLIELTRGIGKHLNQFVDDVKLSSRASQEAIDAVQHDIDSVRMLSDDIQSALDAGHSQLDSQVALLEQAVANLGIDLNQLASILDDINFRSAVNLAELQDASMRAADLQERAIEIRGDMELIVSMVGDVNSAGTQLNALLSSDWTRQRHDRIAADLGDTQANSPTHALPSSAGGELELAREIVIDAIFKLKGLGTVDTSQASQLVAMADANYNAGHYSRAYQLFKQAYQALDGLSEGR